MLKWLLIALYCMYAGRKVRIVENCDRDHNKVKMLRSHFFTTETDPKAAK